MNPRLFVPAFFAAVLSSIFLVLVGLWNYRFSHKAKFSFGNGFPYELYTDAHLRFSGYVKVLIVLSSLAFILFGFGGFAFPSLVSAIIVMTGYTLTSLALMSLFITDMRYAKLHVFLASAFFVMTALTAASVSYFAFTTPYDIFHPALAYVAAGLALFEVLVAINPRLKHWEKLEAVAQKDGTVAFERPRHFVLPLSEWLTMGVFLLLTIAIFLFWLL